MMNLFRRIFSNDPSKPTADSGTPTTTPAPQPITELKVEAPYEAPTTAPDIAPHIIADGATRPLSQESLLSYLGNDHLIFGQLSDVGMVRNNNQDAVLCYFVSSRSADERPDFGLFMVADGMGGHHDGEKASALAIKTVAATVATTIWLPMLSGQTENQAPITEALTEAIQKANGDIMVQVPDGGTTFSSVILIGDLAYVAHVGDSRVYMISKDGVIEQLTRDHSLVQRLIELDQLTPEEAAEHPQKNVLYRALGQNDVVEVDTMFRRVPPKSSLVVCSDGLWNQVQDKEIVDIVRQNSNPQDACNKLVALANKRGGLDNVTVVVLNLPG
ncbi:MAG: serine/threonine-protein phosphatase [Chloroflexi bacterium]|uniref:PP2C family protein-serine/threonine phosphatase n=1 Tax=Candidatus Flexifilum breve TaxID=3140694 RepID=UPI0031367B73|nr:serine/threonine-protein phosphatase [Chloroflexota bacterium]